MQSHVLQTLVNTPDLIACGPTPFEKLVMLHDGERWVVTMEAIVTEEASSVPR